jgi:hypothetical protein
MTAPIALALLVSMLAMDAGAHDDSTVAEMRDLYVNAEYERAVAVAGTIDAAGLPASERAAIAGYQAACLIALGRDAEAEAVMAIVVRAAPLQTVPVAASPKVTALFTAVRTRTLPELVRERYTGAKTLLEAKRYGDAEAAFRDVQTLVTAAEAAAVAGTLADIRLLATEFETVAKDRAARATIIAATPVPVAPAVRAAAPAAVHVSDRTERGVVGPVTITQRITLGNDAARFAAQRRSSPTPLTAELIVTISETGRVERAALTRPVAPALDDDLVASALRWEYQPARRDGSPVKYAKIVRVEIK